MLPVDAAPFLGGGRSPERPLSMSDAGRPFGTVGASSLPSAKLTWKLIEGPIYRG